MMRFTFLLTVIAAFSSSNSDAFQAPATATTTAIPRPGTTTQLNAATASAFGSNNNNGSSNSKSNKQDDKSAHFLLNEFATYAGEVVNPYNTLKVSRDADRQAVRKAYIQMSKKYHPDGVRHRDMLPGKCNNLDDVREEWERIKLSYEILSDRRTRQRYDRHEMVANPGAAFRRAAVGAVGLGVKGMGKGLFQMGKFAIEQIAKVDETKSQQQQQ